MASNDLKQLRVRLLLAQRGVHLKDVAAAIGLSLASVSRLVSRRISCPLGRRKIENFFNEPIWSSYEEFEEARRITLLAGLDLTVAHLKDVRKRAREVGCTGMIVRRLNRKGLTDLILRQIAQGKEATVLVVNEKI